MSIHQKSWWFREGISVQLRGKEVSLPFPFLRTPLYFHGRNHRSGYRRNISSGWNCASGMIFWHLWKRLIRRSPPWRRFGNAIAKVMLLTWSVKDVTFQAQRNDGIIRAGYRQEYKLVGKTIHAIFRDDELSEFCRPLFLVAAVTDLTEGDICTFKWD